MRDTLVVGQSGGPTPVINSSLVGVIRQARRSGYRRILGLRYAANGLLNSDFIDLTDIDEATLHDLARTPSAALGSGRLKLKPEELALCLSNLQAADAGAFIYIGGNDSADTSHRLAELAAAQNDPLRVIAVPKTIDNDLPLTDHTPGFGSTARFIATATLETTLDTRAVPDLWPVKVMEVMGRYAGWLAASSALARTVDPNTPHLIYLPEVPFDDDKFIADVDRTVRERRHCIIVVSEHIAHADGSPVTSSDEPTFVDTFGHAYYASPAEVMVQMVIAKLNLRARYDKPGALQRMSRAMLSEVDLAEAELCGAAAVAAAATGISDKMVALQRVPGPHYEVATELVPLAEIANTERKLPAEFIAPSGTDVTQAFIDYALPLIGGPLPRYVSLG